MKKCILSHRIFTQDGNFDGGMVVEGTIKAFVTRAEALQCGYPLLDCGDNLVLPGLIELHTHGFLGWSIYTVNPLEITSLAQAMTSVGVTAFTPTSQLYEDSEANLSAIAAVKCAQSSGARIVGVHMQGPFISPDFLGSVSIENTAPVDIELMKRFIKASSNSIRTVTIAPELAGITPLMEFLNKQGIVISIGHSGASYEQTLNAINYGAIISQKTGNCMKGIHHRDINVLGACLLEDRIYSEVNSDCNHLSVPFMEMVYRLKGYERLCIVSDSSFLAGMPEGHYSVSGRTFEVCKNHMLHNEAGIIAGSAASILFGLQNWVKVMGKPLEKVIQMASLNPAKVLGIETQKGSLAVGKDADFIVVNAELELCKTYIAGNLEYDADNASFISNQLIHALF